MFTSSSLTKGRYRGRAHLLALALVLGCVVAVTAPVTPGPADPERYLEHVKALTSPEMEGRGAGTAGLERAAAYIVQQFKSLGLEPRGGEGSYLQPFLVTTGARLKPENHFIVRWNEREETLLVEEDYIPMSFSSVGSVSGPVVFAGYGVSADEFNYDDYTHLDVEDKIVVVLRYEPDTFTEKKEGEPRRYTHHSRLITKALNARQRGAKAVILVNGKLESGEEDLLLRFGTVAGPEDAGILMVQVKNAVAEKWLQAAGKSLPALQEEIESHRQPQSFALPDSLTLSLQVDIERTHATVHNILGYLPGKTDEYIVIGAHYDHLGLGNESSLAPSLIGTVHPGADDNASGTAGVLELARLFAARRDALERGVLFAAFAGEELGLLGSSRWVNQPTRPLDKAVGMINMDMIGRIQGSKVYVGGTGTGSTFQSLLERARTNNDFQIEFSSGGYSASDNTSFTTKEIPALFFFSGLHGDYHKPSDTWEKIDAEAAARLLDLIADVGTELIAAEKRPDFVRVTSDSAGAPVVRGGGYGPYFGSVPDFGQSENGVKFADIRPDSPADKAGLRAGDILIQFGEIPIKNLYDFTFALRKSKVGDVVEVKCLRDGEVITARVTLEQRR
jgi:aminopeptidase YwaD